jgi:hypothetical protein
MSNLFNSVVNFQNVLNNVEFNSVVNFQNILNNVEYIKYI